MTSPLAWGILGTGLIAKRFAKGVRESAAGALAAVGSRRGDTAAAFAEEFDVPRHYGSYDAVLADDGVQAVYISTPHPMHAEWAVKCAEAGKHVLVEKPIGMNWHEAMAMIDAAAEHDVFLMEAFMYRCHPQMAKVVELIRSGAIGQVQLMTASFAYRTDASPQSRFFAMDLGGGGILDVGCYPISLARLVAGAAVGKPFDEPMELKGVGRLGVTGTDDYAAAVLQFTSGVIAQVSTGLRLNMHDDQTARIYGSEGSIFIPNPWVPSHWNREPAKLILKRHADNSVEEIAVSAPHDLYAYEADAVARNIDLRQAPEMSWDDSLGNMRALDRWRKEIGLIYDLEKPKNAVHTLTRRPLSPRRNRNMQYGRIAGSDKPISRLIFGCDSNHAMPDTAILCDDYFERGGNAFDTSYGYGNPNGACERNLGQWIRNRGVRDQVVVIEKGANAPNNTPEGLTRELLAGLERLQMDQVDFYFIHRDNLAVPIGEWVDVLNEHWSKGRMKLFGVSNFTLARLIAAGEYAEKNNKRYFSAVSNNFSLARMLDPVWDLCVASSDPDSRAWFTRTQMPLMPWSSQGRGFFLPHATPDNRTNPELVRSWYGAANFQRQARAKELAAKKGVEPINIALAYVLHQPFPTFPLIGPKRIRETASCFSALDIELSEPEVNWLNLNE